jgi:hypothetical protein
MATRLTSKKKTSSSVKSTTSRGKKARKSTKSRAGAAKTAKRKVARKSTKSRAKGRVAKRG